MNFKFFKCLLGVAIAVSLVTSGLAETAIYTSSWSGTQLIPDNNPSGVAYTFSFHPTTKNTILGISLNLQTTGGWDGDLYAYLSHGSGFSVLLNRIGKTSANAFGSGASGFNVQFSDIATADIHAATGGTVSGIFAADGRSVNPLSVVDTDARTALLDSFDGLNAAGDWTLFLADLSPAGNSTLKAWSVSLNVDVPENGGSASLLGLSLICLGMAKFSGNRTVQHFR